MVLSTLTAATALPSELRLVPTGDVCQSPRLGCTFRTAVSAEDGRAIRDGGAIRQAFATGVFGWRIAPNFFVTTNMKAVRRPLDPQNRSPG